jgi:hypothetical protein
VDAARRVIQRTLKSSSLEFIGNPGRGGQYPLKNGATGLGGQQPLNPRLSNLLAPQNVAARSVEPSSPELTGTPGRGGQCPLNPLLLSSVAPKDVAGNRPVSVHHFPCGALTLCPQLGMGIRPGARFTARSAHAQSATCMGFSPRRCNEIGICRRPYHDGELDGEQGRHREVVVCRAGLVPRTLQGGGG